MTALLDWNEPQLRAWIAEGHSVPWIAKELARPYDIVRLKLKRMGISTDPTTRTHCARRHHFYAEVGSSVNDRGHRICHACRAIQEANTARKRAQGNAMKRRVDPTRCRNGHDLTLPDAFIERDHGDECRQCHHAGVARSRARHPNHEPAKWKRDEPIENADTLLEGAVLLETAPPWIKHGSVEDKAAWLRDAHQRRIELMG